MFTSVSFEKLITRIAESDVCNTLKELNLESSVNFDSDESVRKFTDIIAIAPVLEECMINNSNCNRSV